MILGLSVDVGESGAHFGGVQAQVDQLPIHSDAGLPFSSLFVERVATNQTAIVLVFLVGDDPKIGAGVILRITIVMIHALARLGSACNQVVQGQVFPACQMSTKVKDFSTWVPDSAPGKQA